MKIVDKNRPLAAIVCGFTGGGTTMLTEVLRQHPRLDSAFEGGFLLTEEASDFLTLEPYYSALKKTWQVSDQQLARICSVDTWPAVYRRLRQNSPVIKNKNVLLFDKTPRYMTCLSQVLRKVPNVPCISLVRDPRAVFWTRIKRTFRKESPEMNIQEWAEAEFESGVKGYSTHAEGLQQALKSELKERILLVKYEELCLNPEVEARKIFNFLKLNSNADFLSFKGGKPRFRPCRDDGIKSSYISEYKKNLPSHICNAMAKSTDKYMDFHYNLGE